MARSVVSYFWGSKRSRERLTTGARGAASNVLFWLNGPKRSKRRTSWNRGAIKTSPFLGGRRRRRTDIRPEIVLVPTRTGRYIRTGHKGRRS